MKDPLVDRVLIELPSFFRELPPQSGVDEHGPYFGQDLLRTIWETYTIHSWAGQNTVIANRAWIAPFVAGPQHLTYQTLDVIDELTYDRKSIVDAPYIHVERVFHLPLISRLNEFISGLKADGISIRNGRVYLEDSAAFGIKVVLPKNTGGNLHLRMEYEEYSGVVEIQTESSTYTFSLTNNGYFETSIGPTSWIKFKVSASGGSVSIKSVLLRRESTGNGDKPLIETYLNDSGVLVVEKKTPSALQWSKWLLNDALDLWFVGDGWRRIWSDWLKAIWAAAIRPHKRHLELAWAAANFIPLAWTDGPVYVEEGSIPELGSKIRIGDSELTAEIPWPAQFIKDVVDVGEPIVIDGLWKLQAGLPLPSGYCWTWQDGIAAWADNWPHYEIQDGELRAQGRTWNNLGFNAPVIWENTSQNEIVVFSWPFISRVAILSEFLRKLLPPSAVPIIWGSPSRLIDNRSRVNATYVEFYHVDPGTTAQIDVFGADGTQIDSITIAVDRQLPNGAYTARAALRPGLAYVISYEGIISTPAV